MKIEIVRYKMINKNSVLALATIKVPEWGNLLIDNMTLFFKPPNKWISFPSRKDDKGKYWEYMRFESHQDKKDFGHEVFKAFEAKMAQDKISIATSEPYEDARNYYD